jgi:hypothetical protein
MGIYHSGALSAAVLVLSIATSYGGPCSVEIEHMQERVDTMIAATAAAGASARQSTAATMHRQPTPGSIAAAEERLGEGERAVHALTALAQACGRSRR